MKPLVKSQYKSMVDTPPYNPKYQQEQTCFQPLLLGPYPLTQINLQANHCLKINNYNQTQRICSDAQILLWTIVGGKNLSSQLQNATSKFSGKFQVNVIKSIKLDDDMCHLNWHHIGISKFATCHLAHRIKINFLFKIYG